MARDPDGKPIETRGRRSVSQRARDFSERLRSLGAIFDGSPKILEATATSAFVLGLVWSLRPKLIVTKAGRLESRVEFRGEKVLQFDFVYPDRFIAEDLAILTALVVARGQGEIGSLLVPAGSSFVFKKAIEALFPFPDGYTAGDVAADKLGGIPNFITHVGQVDVTLHIYTNYVFPRYVRALLVASFFYLILRYTRQLGP